MLQFKRKRGVILTVLIVGALIAAVGSAVIYLKNRDTMTLKGDIFVSVMGTEQEYNGKNRLIYKENTMYLVHGKVETDTMGMPVYIDEGNSMVLTGVMSFTDFTVPLLKRVNYFGKVTKGDVLCSVSTDGKKKEKEVKGGYLFDGKDTYVFLEPVTLKYGDVSRKLAPLSYVTVRYRNCVFGYSSEEKESFYDDWGETGVKAEAENGEYTLNLSSDLADLRSGVSQMLVPNPEVLPLFQ